jgi:hypothetical protein
MVVDMAAVNVGRHDKGILPAEDFCRQPLADFVRLLRRGFPRRG